MFMLLRNENIVVRKKFILIAGGDATSTISPTAKEGNGQEQLTTKGSRTGRSFMQLLYCQS